MMNLTSIVRCDFCEHRFQASLLANKIVANGDIIPTRIVNPKDPLYRSGAGDYLGDCPKCDKPVYEPRW